MRLLPSALCTVLTLGLIYFDNPEPTHAMTRSLATSLDKFLHHKKISLVGLNRTTAEELSPLIPTDKSVLWWVINKDQVETALKRNANIKGATVELCNKYLYRSWGCFQVRVQERKPKYLARVGDQDWILGDDGGFLSPDGDIRYDDHTKLRELVVKAESPDAVEARLRYTRKAVEIIEEVSGFTTETARCTSSGEVRVRFDKHPFEAVFDYAENDPDKLRQEALRMKRVVEEFGPRISTVELIDLAYNKLAVVRFQPTPVAVKGKKK